MKADELIRRGTINQVKSEQAIRRSKRLLNGSTNLLEHRTHAQQSSAEVVKTLPRTEEIVRQEAREAREKSSKALEHSQAARKRQVALRKHLSSTKPTN